MGNMMKPTRLLLGAASLLALAHGAFAAELTPEAVKRCAAVTDSLARLVCYDQLASGTSSPAPAPAPAPATAPAVSAPAAPKPAAAVAVAPAALAIGDETIKGASEPREIPTSLTAKVTELESYRAYNYYVHLDNGQGWLQEEMQTGFVLEVGDTVQVERGRMGGYKMARVHEGKPGMWVRVTRKK
jgi:hypothetical protein